MIASDPSRDVPPSEVVGPGEVGQLIVRGPQVMSGYWNNPFETSKKLKAGWLYTGDLFSKDGDGFFHFHGRADDMIVSGGENIHPREVEEVLYRCPGVRETSERTALRHGWLPEGGGAGWISSGWCGSTWEQSQCHRQSHGQHAAHPTRCIEDVTPQAAA